MKLIEVMIVILLVAIFIFVLLSRRDNIDLDDLKAAQVKAKMMCDQKNMIYDGIQTDGKKYVVTCHTMSPCKTYTFETT